MKTFGHKHSSFQAFAEAGGLFSGQGINMHSSQQSFTQNDILCNSDASTHLRCQFDISLDNVKWPSPF